MVKDEKKLYLTTNDIICLHNVIISKTGGESGILNKGNLEYIVDVMKNPFYPMHIFDLAVFLIFKIILNHPFADGNKRTGYESMVTFLNKNGYSLQSTPEDVVKLTVSIACGQVDEQYVKNWITQRLAKD